MEAVRYAKKAYTDLDDIVFFTLKNWGTAQSENYIDDLHELCLLIAQHPLIGRSYGPALPRWRRLEHESHIVLYAPSPSGITVQRIMHKSRLLQQVIR